MRQKVELHVHTEYSYDSDMRLTDIIEVCQKKKINVLAVCDHNEIRGALKLREIAPFQVIVGEEIQTREGEIIGLFLQRFIKPGRSLDITIQEIRAQEGIVYLPHPFDSFTRKTSIVSERVSQIADKIDVIEVYNGRTIKPWDNNQACKLARRYGKLMAVGSDAHTKYEIGRDYLLMPDFSGSREFLKSLAKAERKLSLPLFWVFLITKWVRFKKKNSEHFKVN